MCVCVCVCVCVCDVWRVRVRVRVRVNVLHVLAFIVCDSHMQSFGSCVHKYIHRVFMLYTLIVAVSVNERKYVTSLTSRL